MIILQQYSANELSDEKRRYTTERHILGGGGGGGGRPGGVEMTARPELVLGLVGSGRR